MAESATIHEMPRPGTKACQESFHDRLHSLEQHIACLPDIQRDVIAIKDMLAAWNAVQGFGTTIRWLARTAGTLAVISAFFGGIWYMLITGHWPPK